jgi:hypothetical protein
VYDEEPDLDPEVYDEDEPELDSDSSSDLLTSL